MFQSDRDGRTLCASSVFEPVCRLGFRLVPFLGGFQTCLARWQPVGQMSVTCVVGVAFEDGEGTVNLLEENDAGKFVREGHLA
jgi:hypothetical protein